MFWLSKSHSKFQSCWKNLDMEILYSCPVDLMLAPNEVSTGPVPKFSVSASASTSRITLTCGA